MHTRLALFVFSAMLLLLGCTNASEQKPPATPESPDTATTESTGKQALQFLFNQLNKSPSTSFVHDEIRTGNGTVRLKIKEEFDGQKEGNWVYAAGITTTWNSKGQYPVTTGAIGMGKDRKEAMQVCLQEWMAVFGKPFAAMLNQQEGIELGALKIFPGMMGIRGQLPANTWLNGDEAMNKKIIDWIRPLLLNNAHAIVPVDIKLLITADGAVDGECRIDNQVSFELLKLLKKMDWPRPADRFIFSQFYLVDAAAR